MLRIYSFLLLVFVSHIFCGSAGVKNGTISGSVREGVGKPLGGVTVFAVFQGQPQIIRQAISDANGAYVLNNLRVGKYALGFQKYGYETISAEETSNSTEGSKLGPTNLKAYVESGGHFVMGPVTLKSLGAFGTTRYSIRILDSLTGETIPEATVTIGVHQAYQMGDGTYAVDVPTEPGEASKPLEVSVFAPGFKDTKTQLLPAPGGILEQVLQVEPEVSEIDGFINLGGLPSANLFSQATILVDGLPKESLNAQTDDSGYFRITVPASTPERLRSFHINIFMRGFFPIRIPNVVAPMAGSTTISYTPSLTPQTVAVVGQVNTLMGGTGRPSASNQAVIVELGVTAPIQAGTFVFPSVPVEFPLTLKVFLINEKAELSSAETEFTAAMNGTGSFSLPTLITQP